MQHWSKVLCMAILGLFIAVPAFATTKASMDANNEMNKAVNVKCVKCHLKENKSMVLQWKNSPHAAAGVACYNCHAGQKEKAKKTLLEKSYPGNYTFADGDIFVLVVEKTDVILALYRKNEEAGKELMKQMVADLMARFGNPTSEAHDQIIYWAYGAKGKISDEEYDSLKHNDERGIIATVKFKSKLTFTENAQESDQENSIHCIVSSPPMLERFYRQ